MAFNTDSVGSAAPEPPSSDLMDRFLSEVEGIQRRGGYFTGRCPAHHDTHASLSFRRGETQPVVARCHAGCSWDDIVKAVDPYSEASTPASIATAEEIVYPYRDEDGEVLYEVVRSGGRYACRSYNEDAGQWRHELGNVRRVPYNLPDVISAASAGERIYIVEGEKDAVRLSSLGLVATTNPFGAGKWRDEWAPYFKGAHVVILPDNDDPGRSHAEDVRDSLAASAESVVIVPLPDLPEKGDVSDWLNDGHTLEELEDLVNNCGSCD